MSGGYSTYASKVLNDFIRTGRKENFRDLEDTLNNLKEMIINNSIGSAVRPQCEFKIHRITTLPVTSATHMVRFVIFTEDITRPGLRKMILQCEEEFDFSQKVFQQMAANSIYSRVHKDLISVAIATLNKNTPIAQFYDSGEIAETPDYAL